MCTQELPTSTNKSPPTPLAGGRAGAGKGCAAVPHAALIVQGTSDDCHKVDNHTVGHVT